MFVQKGQHKLLLSTASQALFNVRTSLAVLGEVLNGTNHLRGVGVLVVVPRHDLNLIGVVVATLIFHVFLWSFIISKQQLQYHSIPLSYQNRLVRTKIIPRLGVIFKFFRDFVFLDFFAFPHFLCVWIFMWYRAWSSERPGPGASAGAFALPRCAPQGEVMMGWMMGWMMGVLMDRIEWWVIVDFLKNTFGVIGVILMCWLLLIASCLWCSLLFICPVTTLPVLSPATSFAEISPEVILDYGIKTGILLFDIKQSFYYKTAWMRFCNHIHTVWGLKKIFQFFEYLVCTHAACK